MYTLNEIVPALREWDVSRPETLLLPLLLGFRIEVFGFRGEDEIRGFRFVEDVEEVVGLRVEPGCLCVQPS